MMSHNAQEFQQAWAAVEGILFVPHNEAEYQQLVSIFDQLIDIIGEDDTHPLASLMELLGVLIEKYEDDHVPEITEI